ncbi:hypothetical protein F9278_38870 [Streptomyces phaeolivaceus]|uniref:Uncharacterized protein n=1 Tax=Streptomyces phaeolivaceus TaxID=2653200 RepID=A0A5P8KCV3_9ACTN|nr:hypothetical protein [Streptomyces phaeolivaceus]QFR01164.1 hypothetical protein F9278_38870 [Streptomyces phaeolivaceus]
MDPIAPELLMALAGGTAGAAGQQIWASLRELVSRRPRGEEAHGEGELNALARTADDTARARELADVLTLRAARDAAFATALDAWRGRAEALAAPPATGTGDVRNEVGGTVHGPLIQARDIHGSIHLGPQGPGPA